MLGIKECLNLITLLTLSTQDHIIREKTGDIFDKIIVNLL